jgi:F420 biosynthesis protein FbiB-like protein
MVETDLLRLINERRSVRNYLDRPVNRALLEQVIDCACQAPSAHNRQPWRFVVLASQEIRQRLADGMGASFYNDLLQDGVPKETARYLVDRSRDRLLEAPAAVLICLDRYDADLYPDEARQTAELMMQVQGVAMAGENMLLAAQACELGGVWICAPLFAQEAVRLALGLPESWYPQGLVYLGYPVGVPEKRPRLPLSDVVVYLE